MNKQQLKATLWVLEMRLGTPEEQPDDGLMARALAHQLNNLLTIEVVREELGRLPAVDPAPPSNQFRPGDGPGGLG